MTSAQSGNVICVVHVGMTLTQGTFVPPGPIDALCGGHKMLLTRSVRKCSGCGKPPRGFPCGRHTLMAVAIPPGVMMEHRVQWLLNQRLQCSLLCR